MRSTFTTTSVEETRALGGRIARERGAITCIALIGDLGVGKTEIVRGFCVETGCTNEVSSPTFTIINEYGNDPRIFHCDLYRLDAIAEMIAIGLDELFTGNEVVLVEWADKALDLLPVPRIEIRGSHASLHGERRWTVETLLHEHVAAEKQ